MAQLFIRRVARGVEYDNQGGNLGPIYMCLVMSEVLKKLGCQEQNDLHVCILQTRTLTDHKFQLKTQTTLKCS